MIRCYVSKVCDNFRHFFVRILTNFKISCRNLILVFYEIFVLKNPKRKSGSYIYF